ncbi:uncharacterized protein LOC143885909 [Tasmannia lanceolata]|uniref:uncharacterized protein LOC143885909 n=1 Tax=Tasmannia lanceolata TaxID=3420 RepID=UPI004062F1E2
METLETNNKLFSSLVIILSFSSLFFHTTKATTPTGTIERTTKQQLLASLNPTTQTTPVSENSQLFITSPSGRYEGYLLRRETAPGAGGFGSDFCYIQIQESGNSVWESECASVSTVNTCSLVFSDAGLEIFDGSRSSWDNHADGDHLETLILLDSGDMQIREHGGDLAWKASDSPLVNQECGSVGSPGLNSGHPPFASPIPGAEIGFGQPLSNQHRQPPLGFQNQQPFGYQQQQQQPLNQPFSNLNSPFGVNSQPLVDNSPFNSGSHKEVHSKFGVVLAFIVTLVAYVFLL